MRKVAAWGGLIGLGSDAGAYQVFHGEAMETEAAYLEGIPTLEEATDYVKAHF